MLAPLAERMRPQVLDHLYGQSHICSENANLRRLIERQQLRSAIFWGPPGCGKTTLAKIIALRCGCEVVHLSAVSAGVKDLRDVIAQSEAKIARNEKELLLFLDEIHRLNKNQQDVLLPALELGLLRFVGATTENPSFAVNSAINSRCLIFRLDGLDVKAIKSILLRAMKEDEHLSRREVEEAVLDCIANSAGGDARRGLNLLEAIIESAKATQAPIGLSDLKGFSENLTNLYDKDGEQHYDIVSAMIKSIRASHPDAALHYLAKMIDGGEKPEFIARRLVISAAEDIGNANPHMLGFANAALQAVLAVGMPEGRIILGQITTLLASSPKSNRSYIGIDKALADVREFKNLSVPLHLRNAPTQLMKHMGYGKDYVYAHDDVEGARAMAYLPEELKGRSYYVPSEFGFEKQIKETLGRLRPRVD